MKKARVFWSFNIVDINTNTVSVICTGESAKMVWFSLVDQLQLQILRF